MPQNPPAATPTRRQNIQTVSARHWRGGAVAAIAAIVAATNGDTPGHITLTVAACIVAYVVGRMR